MKLYEIPILWAALFTLIYIFHYAAISTGVVNLSLLQLWLITTLATAFLYGCDTLRRRKRRR